MKKRKDVRLVRTQGEARIVGQMIHVSLHRVGARLGAGAPALGGNRRDVRKVLGWFRCDRFLADSEGYRSVGSEGEHNVGSVVDHGAAVPLQKAERGWRADFVREQVWAKSTRDVFSVRLRIVGRSVSGDDTSNSLGDGRTVGGEIVGRTTRIEAIAQVFVVLGEERMDHRKTDAIDRTPATGVGG